MTQEQALEFIEKNGINIDSYKSVIVTSDSAVYLESELKAIADHCTSTGKTYFVVKGQEKSALEVVLEEEIKSEPPKKGKAKK